MPKTKRKFKKQLYRWRHWKYENTAWLLVSLAVVYYLAQTPLLDATVTRAGELGYAGAFVVGIFFVSTFTVAPAALVLYHLAEHLHAVEVAVLAGLGAMLGDYVIFRYTKDRVFEELRPLAAKLQHPKLSLLFKSPFFAWLMPVFGAALIASPLPDEVGIGLLGLTKLRTWQFFALTFVLNAAGIFLVVSASRIS